MVLLSRLAPVLAAVALIAMGWELHQQRMELHALSRRVDRLGELVSSNPLASRQASACVDAPVDANALAATVANLVSTRLAPSRPAPTVGQKRGDGPGEPSVPALTDEQHQNLERSRQLVAAAVQSGTLRKEDVMELRRLEAGIADTQAFYALRGQLIRAINLGQLRQEDPHLPLP